jgi:hypothetical protein
MLGAGVLGLPLLLIFGFYSFQRSVLRLICVLGIVCWMGIFVAMGITHGDWNDMIFPAILGLGWAALHPFLKNAGNEDE